VNLNFVKFKKKNIDLKINIKNHENEPLIKFSDEIMYGLGNIIQNAVKYAKNVVDVNISWDKNFFFVKIKDDGVGFAKEIIDKIGDPYISNNKNSIGLGIFIAKNLIENAGGNINFSNVYNSKGSIVEISLIRGI
jgi:two-component system sensor histidine kinase RegB